MTPSQLAQLVQDLSFEKWALDESLLAMPDPTRGVIDLRGRHPADHVAAVEIEDQGPDLIRPLGGWQTIVIDLTKRI